MGGSVPAIRSVGFPPLIMVLASLAVVSGLGVNLSRKAAVVMVVAVTVMIVVVVGVVALLVVPVVLRRVMRVRLFVVVVSAMMCRSMAVCETLFGAEGGDRRHHGTGQDIQKPPSVHARISFLAGVKKAGAIQQELKPEAPSWHRSTSGPSLKMTCLP